MGGLAVLSTIVVVTELNNFEETSENENKNEEYDEEVLKLVLFVLLVIATVVTIIGNSSVIGAFFIDRRIIQKPANLFILNLSLSDMIIGAIVMPVYLCDKLLPLGLLFPSWIVFCRWWQLFTLLGVISSFHFILMIAYDRYQLVKDPLSYVTHRTLQRILKEIICSWVGCVVIVVAYFVLIYYGQSQSEDSCGVLHPTFLLHPILRYIAVIEPVSLTSFLVGINIGIIIHLYHRTKEIAAYNISEDSSSELVDRSPADSSNAPSLSTQKMSGITRKCERNDLNPNVSDTHATTAEISKVSPRVDRKSNTIVATSRRRGSKSFGNRWPRIALLKKSRKAIHKMFLLVIVYKVCFFPWFVAVILDAFSFEVSLRVIELANIVMWLNSMVNPFLYATTNVRLRRGMKQLMRDSK